MLEPKIKMMEAKKLLGIIRYGDGKNGEFNRVWGKWHQQNEGVNWSKAQTGYGLIFYPPDFKAADEKYQYYMPCMEVDNFDNIPMHMIAKSLPECKCAVFTHKGPVHLLPGFVHSIFYKWLPGSGYELGEAFFLEVYDVENAKFKGPDDSASEIDIIVPLKK